MLGNFAHNALLLLFLFGHVQIHSCFKLFFDKDCIKGRALSGNVVKIFKDFPNPNPAACFSKCAHDCRCESFQFQTSSGRNSVCELNGFPFNTSVKMMNKENYTFCNMTTKDDTSKACHCEQGCCKDVTNPCRAGGGRCIIGCGQHQPRYKCICKDGEVGTKCTPTPNSCLEVLRLDPYAKSGYHTIHLNSSKNIKYGNDDVKYTCSETTLYSEGTTDSPSSLTQVYCDFDNKKAWTLVEAFKHSLKVTFNVPFTIDKPLQNAGDILSEYRMSLKWMQSVKSHSSMWRATCNYKPNVAEDRIDYVETTFQNIDLLSKLVSGCHKVNYININKYQCQQCTTWFSQGPNHGPYFSPKYGEKNGCMFQPSPDQPLDSNVFGNYTQLYGPFRCTLRHDSTTLFWFGGTV